MINQVVKFITFTSSISLNGTINGWLCNVVKFCATGQGFKNLKCIKVNNWLFNFSKASYSFAFLTRQNPSPFSNTRISNFLFGFFGVILPDFFKRIIANSLIISFNCVFDPKVFSFFGNFRITLFNYFKNKIINSKKIKIISKLFVLMSSVFKTRYMAFESNIRIYTSTYVRIIIIYAMNFINKHEIKIKRLSIESQGGHH